MIPRFACEVLHEKGNRIKQLSGVLIAMFSSEAVALHNKQNTIIQFHCCFLVKCLGLQVMSQCEKLCLSIQLLLHIFPLSVSLCIGEGKKENCTRTCKSLVLKYYIPFK